MKAGIVIAAYLLAACGKQAAQQPAEPSGAGPSLERAARAAGLVADPEHVDPTGTYAAGTDGICVLPRGDGTYSVGASVDYGEEQYCVAHGTAQGRTRLDVDFAAGCRFTATLDGDRLSFPVSVPAGCERTCVGRASLDALAGDRVGSTAAEASRMRGADGKILCRG